MKDQTVKLVMTMAHFDEKYAGCLTRHTGTKSLVLAHQTQAVPPATDCLAPMDLNINSPGAALEGSGKQ